jgi:hypothetical protein
MVRVRTDDLFRGHVEAFDYSALHRRKVWGLTLLLADELAAQKVRAVAVTLASRPTMYSAKRQKVRLLSRYRGSTKLVSKYSQVGYVLRRNQATSP